jgi:hypothetical protein
MRPTAASNRPKTAAVHKDEWCEVNQSEVVIKMPLIANANLKSGAAEPAPTGPVAWL